MIKLLIIWISITVLVEKLEAQGSPTPPPVDKIRKPNIEIKQITDTSDKLLSSQTWTCTSCVYCERNFTKIEKSVCPIRTGILDGCITVFLKHTTADLGFDIFVVKGCISEMLNKTIQYCLENEAMCRKCYGEDDCNELDEWEDRQNGGSTLIKSCAVLLALLATWRVMSV